MTGSFVVAVPSVRHAAVEISVLTQKLCIDHLNFYYGAIQALKDICLTLYANKVTAIIGPSGCGKSTLVRVLNGMYKLYPNQRTDGQVLLDGENILDPKQDVN